MEQHRKQAKGKATEIDKEKYDIEVETNIEKLITDMRRKIQDELINWQNTNIQKLLKIINIIL